MAEVKNPPLKVRSIESSRRRIIERGWWYPAAPIFRSFETSDATHTMADVKETLQLFRSNSSRRFYLNSPFRERIENRHFTHRSWNRFSMTAFTCCRSWNVNEKNIYNHSHFLKSETNQKYIFFKFQSRFYIKLSVNCRIHLDTESAQRDKKNVISIIFDISIHKVSTVFLILNRPNTIITIRNVIVVRSCDRANSSEFSSPFDSR